MLGSINLALLSLIAYFGVLAMREIIGALVIGRDTISIVKARCLKSICGLRRVVFLIELTVTFYAVLKSIEGCCICSCKFAVLLFNEILTFSSINKSTKNINKRLRS